jgi:hypothetical protein
MTDNAMLPPAEVSEAERDRAVDLLNRLLSHKADSLFAFVLAASPYVAEGDEERLRRVESIAREHEEQAKAITRAILDLDGVPNPVGHDTGVADLNYLSLRYLVKVLIEYQEHVLAESREDLRALRAFPEAARLMQRIVETDEKQLDILRSVAS